MMLAGPTLRVVPTTTHVAFADVIVLKGIAGSGAFADSGQALGSQLRLRILARDVSLATEAPQQTSIQNVLPCVIDALQAARQAEQLAELEIGGGA